jgi:hypothetical protein
MRRFEGLGYTKRKGAPMTFKETTMKRIIQAVVVAVLFTGTYAKAEDAPIVVPSQWTHADRNPSPAGEPVSAFAGSIDEMIVLNAGSTHAAGEAQVASAFPGSAREDPIVVESMTTRADQFAAEERNRQASVAAAPALSE